MTISLPPDIESSIQAAVDSGHFATVDDAMAEAASLLLDRLNQTKAQATTTTVSQLDTSQTDKPIWEDILELTADVPDEEWDKLPVDLAEQHDHYVYGVPKRRPSP